MQGLFYFKRYSINTYIYINSLDLPQVYYGVGKTLYWQASSSHRLALV